MIVFGAATLDFAAGMEATSLGCAVATAPNANVAAANVASDGSVFMRLSFSTLRLQDNTRLGHASLIAIWDFQAEGSRTTARIIE